MHRFEHYFKKILPIALTLPICLCGCTNSASPETSTAEEQSVSALKSVTITTIYEDGREESSSSTYDYSKKDNQYIIKNTYSDSYSSKQTTDYYDSNYNLVKEIDNFYDNYSDSYDDSISEDDLQLFMTDTYHYYVNEDGNNVEDEFEELSDGGSQRSILIKIPDTDDLLEAMYYYYYDYDNNSKKKEFESGKYDKEEAEEHEIYTYDEYGIITGHKCLSDPSPQPTNRDISEEPGTGTFTNISMPDINTDISEESGTRTYTYTDMSKNITGKTIATIDNGKAKIIQKIEYDEEGNPYTWKEYDDNGNLIKIKREDSSSFTRTANITYEDNKLCHYECTFEKPDEADDDEIKTIDVTYEDGHITSINKCMVNGDVKKTTFSYDSDQLTSVITETTNKAGEVIFQENRTYEYTDIQFPAEIISKVNENLNLLEDFEYSNENIGNIITAYLRKYDY